MFLDTVKNKLDEENSLFIGEKTAFRSAVLLPIVKVDGEWHILFERRSLTMRKQPGDSSFPGGRIDSTDSSPMAAALRETYEELGVPPNKIKVIGELSPYIISTSFVVYPFVATLDYDQIIHSYNRDEVEEVFTIPINWLLTHEPYMHKVAVESIPSSTFPFERIANGEQYQWGARSMEQWFFDYETYTIWGLTARILKHFIEIIK